MPIALPMQVFIEGTIHGGSGDAHTFYASSLKLSHSWGLQPASAEITWVNANTDVQVVAFQSLRLELGGRVFYGFIEEAVRVKGSAGTDWTFAFQDSRALLQDDIVKGVFNQRDTRLVNNVVLKRYKHLLPDDVDLRRWTYTNAPYTAREVLDFLFSASTVKLNWLRSYHSALDTPAYDLDFETGRKLGTAILEVSERVGTTFTLLGGFYSLVWTVKGIGLLPVIPQVDGVPQADNIRTGQKLSGHPSRIEIRGDRNLYQVLDVPMVPDWVRTGPRKGWEEFYDQFELELDIWAFEATEANIGDIPAGSEYSNIPGDDINSTIGWQLAAARAKTITVGEYAALRDARDGFNDGDNYRDYRRYNGRSRLNMPASLYIQSILFRAFRVDDNFVLVNAEAQNIALSDLDIVESALVEVTHDPNTGLMEWELDVKSATNGYAIAQGYELGSDAFRTVRPEQFKLEQWLAHMATVWEHREFSIDESGHGYQFILFDQPIIKTSDLIHVPIIDGKLQDFPVVLAGATINPCLVRASLVFAAERFSYTAGLPPRDDVQSEPGLQGQYISRAGLSPEEELPYADGATALEKATILAASLLLRQYIYVSGGFEAPVPTGLDLSSTTDRVTITNNAEQGYTESIDYTTERARNTFEPERDYDRRQQFVNLLPGEREARVEANQQKLLAVGLRQNPKFLKTLTDAIGLIFGHGQPESWPIEKGTGRIPVGTPFYGDGAGAHPVMPSATAGSSGSGAIFLGVSLLDNDNANGQVRMLHSGDLPARVRGPVSANDSLGFSAGNDYLEKDGSPPCATALDDVPDGETKLIMARFGGGGGSPEPDPRWS